MKAETQIAQGNVEKYKKAKVPRKIWGAYYNYREHKATCHRFLEFLKSLLFNTSEFFEGQVLKKNIKVREMIKKRISDLEKAIKLYNEAGI